MKKIFYSLIAPFLACVYFPADAQTGPGGVGSASNLEVWLDANSLGLTNNDAVSSWTDLSGNNNHAAQATGSFQPTFLTNQINGFPAIDFDGSDDFLEFGTHITSSSLSFFTVFQSSTAGPKALLAIDKHIFRGRNIDGYARYGGTEISIRKTFTPPSIFTVTTDASATGNFTMTCDNNASRNSRTSFSSVTRSTVGTWFSSPTVNIADFNGIIPEMIIYNTELDSASRNIVTNYLSSKYDLPAIRDLYAYDATHPNEVLGIGQEADGSNTSARGTDAIQIDNPSSLGDGDYLLIGNDAGGFAVSSSVAADMVERWTQVWRADVTGTPGTVDIEFFLETNGFASASNYVILIDDDGDFTNGGTTTHETGRSFQAIPEITISFTGLSLSDGDYFTLAEKVSGITTAQAGDWNDPDTWSCSCEPGAADVVTIEHTVTVTANANILDIDIQGGGLAFSGSDTLFIAGDLNSDVAVTLSNGTIVANSSSLTQNFTNTATFRFNNFQVNGSGGASFNSGTWTVFNSFRITSGTIDVSGADSFTMLSDASQTSQILESISGAITGDFTLQRYISARNANFSNFSSPITNATVASLDDDLFLSGVGGADGNATTGGGGIFYSMYSYNRLTDAHETITSTSTGLFSGRGYEVYLATDISSFSATTIDYVGTPHIGTSVRSDVNRFWNLIGNPFYSFVDWDAVDKTAFVNNSYYIFNTDNGTYDFFSGGGMPAIAPGQGFWVYQPNTGGYKISWAETDKVSSTSSTFIRKKSVPEFSLSISTDENPFKHQMKLNFDANARATIDEGDAYYLPSPIETAPAIYSMADNDNKGLIYNNLSSFDETQLIPIEVYTGTDGQYTIEASEIERLYDNYDCIYLKDKESNSATDLSLQPVYQFESKRGTQDRFELILSNDYNKCMQLLEGKSTYNQDLDHALDLRNSNGLWYIDYALGEDISQVEISVYNTSGQLVKESISFSASYAGSYPLHELQGMNGIYLIRVKTVDKIINKTVKL